MKRSVAELYREAGILEMLPDAQVPESPVPSLAPAERDCKATVLDSESDEKTIADSESDAQQDHLFRLWETEPQTLQASPSESFDSQLSQNEDPNGHQCPHISDERHWSEDATFWKNVEDVLAICLHHLWFSNEFFYDAPVLFEQNKAASANFIRKLLSEGEVTKFKIGITENPWQRWQLYCRDCKYQRFRVMYILYAAPTSKWKATPYDSERRKELKRTSTGAMEIALIEEFEDYPECVNRKGAGGECASDGSPHFVYVVIL
jgi:hypothetical protein